jgi:lysophospholipase L1-like esterase
MSFRSLLPRAAFLLPGVLFAAIAASAHAQPTPYPPADDTSAWAGKGPIRVFPWMTENRNYFWTRRDKDQGAVVFVGDSLVGNWKLGDMNTMLEGTRVANRGIGGDVTRGVLFRLQEDVLDLHPKAVVICIGTNDLSAKAKLPDVIDNMTQILEKIHAANADTPVLLCLLPPRASQSAPVAEGVVADLNEQLKGLAASHPKVKVIDLYSALGNADGSPNPEYFGKDLLHMNAKGQEKWASLLKPVFVELKLNSEG